MAVQVILCRGNAPRISPPLKSSRSPTWARAVSSPEELRVNQLEPGVFVGNLDDALAMEFEAGVASS